MSEASFIRKITALFPNNAIGDDCAIFSHQTLFNSSNPQENNEYLLVSTDTLVENIHFNLSYFSLEEAGYRALAVNLSDIAACGGKPLFFSISITVPSHLTEADILKIYHGFKPLADKYALILSGGDIVSGSSLSITITIFGTTKTPLKRSGAKINNNVYVTGTLGGSAHALSYYLTGKTPSLLLAERHKKPEARVELIQKITGKYNITACIDVSDGLSLDLSRMQYGNIGFEIDYSKLPVHPELAAISPPEIDDFVLSGGEDFELVFTSPEDIILEDVTKIGRVNSTGKIELIQNGIKTTLEPRGYDHFQRKC